MPIVYRVDQTTDVVHTTWTGRINAAVLAGHWQTFLADPAVLASGRVVADVRAAEVELNSADLRTLLDGVARSLLGARSLRVAIVVSGPVQFGLARQYMVFAEPIGPSHVFTDLDDAVAWVQAGAR